MSDLFITLHDASSGKPFRVRASSIDALCDVNDGEGGCIVMISGTNNHVEETARHVEAMVRPSLRR